MKEMSVTNTINKNIKQGYRRMFFKAHNTCKKTYVSGVVYIDLRLGDLQLYSFAVDTGVVKNLEFAQFYADVPVWAFRLANGFTWHWDFGQGYFSNKGKSKLTSKFENLYE